MTALLFTPEGFPEPGPAYLQPTEFLDFDVPAVRDFAARHATGAADARDAAIRLYYAVRDAIRYDPFSIRLDPATFRASRVLADGRAFCIPKAVLLAAAARAVGIPAAIGLSDVRNHLTSPKLAERMGGRTLFMHHGYAVLHIEGRWVKAAPAFNLAMCTRFGVQPTEFDGRSDATLQEFDACARRHMEYVRDHGVWSDLPHLRIAQDFAGYYPPSFYGDTPGAGADFG